MNCKSPESALLKLILSRMADIEAWFRSQWAATPPVLMSSVDLRYAGFKLAPVDTNLFPAGFNNLNPAMLPMCVQALQATLNTLHQTGRRVLLVPEAHTRNPYYPQHLQILRALFLQAGFEVKLGHWEHALVYENGLQVEKIEREGDRVKIGTFEPCMVVLNNDLSGGIPALLEGISQPIFPPLTLGWATRRKSDHFQHYAEVAALFAELLGCDGWWIDPYKKGVSGINFMTQAGLAPLAQAVDEILEKIRQKYHTYHIEERPFVIVKADNGTYGMNVMTVYQGEAILTLNRKQRTKMAAGKEGQTVDQVLVQEGVYTFETTADGLVAEPVVYMIGSTVVGGFYRVHQHKGVDANLNSPGMHFEQLPFEKACNTPCCESGELTPENCFYAYGVIARLAALAASREARA